MQTTKGFPAFLISAIESLCVSGEKRETVVKILFFLLWNIHMIAKFTDIFLEKEMCFFKMEGGVFPYELMCYLFPFFFFNSMSPPKRQSWA